MVIPYTRGSTWEQPPPDLASHSSKNRIIYSGMSLVPSVTELILAEFLYLQYEDEEKPIYLYMKLHWDNKGQVFINVFPHVKQFMDGKELVYETEAFAVYDVMGYVKLPIFTLCEGNAWGEAALLLAAGSKSIGRFQGQVTDVDIARKVKNVKAELVNHFAKHVRKSPGQIEADMSRPKYFSPTEAIEYRHHRQGFLWRVIYNERSTEDRGVVSDLKKAQLT